MNGHETTSSGSVNGSQRTILIIEDEEDISDLVAFNLQRAGMKVMQSADGEAGLKLAYKENPDLIVLDLMLPTLNGVGVLKGLKRDPRTIAIPVILLTARAQTEDRIQGLSLGADDYLTKPFSPKELVLRVQVILKRIHKNAQTENLQQGAFRFNKNALKFYVDSEEVELTSTEFKLLLLLCESPNQVLSRSDILRHVWGFCDDVVSRTLDTHIKRVRQKIGVHASVIETIRGVGYRMHFKNTAPISTPE